ncbi:hypothetical protein KUTeg_013480 [Tegillarca granosa]|uniref:Cadherin domain-containing protein n=1 Tax=Tegillarca granosa TaxID=220873 RepID=A0ABQ9EXB3_TEGGR|nr:hypothetical protein KUTeg_013480 [Tegillarca granosa]
MTVFIFQNKFGNNCTAYCSDDKVLKGDVDNKVLTCQLNGEWTTSQIFCAPKNRAPTDLDNNKLMENSPEGTLIGCMEGIDDDPGQSVSLLLVDSDDGLFETYTSDDGKLCLKVVSTIKFKIDDVNEAPFDLQLKSFDSKVNEPSISENKRSFMIGEISVKDQDGDDLTINVQDTANGRIAYMNKRCKALTTSATANLDYETQDTYEITILVMDNGNPPMTMQKTFTMKVTNENEAPTLIYLSNDKVKKSDMMCNGKLCILNYESETQLNVVVMVTDNGSPPLSYEQKITIYVQDTNDPPEDIRLSRDSIRENEPASTVLGNFKFFFSINDWSWITLVKDPSGIECTGDLETTTILDYEVHSTYPLSVTVTDKYGASKTQTVTVIVKDENDDPQNMLLNGKSVDVLEVDENIENVKIADLSTDDPDVGQTFTYNIKSGDEGIFEIQGNELKVKSGVEIDYEKKNKYILLLEVTDSGTPPKALEKTVTINVQNINEAPTSVSISGNQVIKFLLTTSSSVEGTFSITATGVNEAPVSVTFTPENAPITFAENEPVVMENSPVDSVIGTVVAKDQDPDQALTFSVKAKTDVQYIKVDTSPDCTTEDLLFSSDKLEVNENLQGETIGIFQVIDPDDGDSHVFKLTNDGGGNFAIDNKGRLSTSAGSSLDYEATKSVDITVSVTDAKGLSFEKSYNVLILDVNEAPTKIVLTNNKVSTNSQNKDKVNSFGEHCEAKGRHFCTLDYESVKSYDIVVKATDSGNVPLSVEFTLTIDIEDGNDVPTDLNMVANSIPENTPVGQTVATFTVSK